MNLELFVRIAKETANTYITFSGFGFNLGTLYRYYTPVNAFSIFFGRMINNNTCNLRESFVVIENKTQEKDI